MVLCWLFINTNPIIVIIMINNVTSMEVIHCFSYSKERGMEREIDTHTHHTHVHKHTVRKRERGREEGRKRES